MAPAAHSRCRSCETSPRPIPSSARRLENPSTARRCHPRGRLKLSSTARCKSRRPDDPSPVSCLTAAAPTRARGSPTTPLVQFHDVDSFFLRTTIYNDASLKSHPSQKTRKDGAPSGIFAGESLRSFAPLGRARAPVPTQPSSYFAKASLFTTYGIFVTSPP